MARAYEESFRPQQGLTIMNSEYNFQTSKKFTQFPSPTGVNYYEFSIGLRLNEMKKKLSFRPQQGLTIMNPYLQNPDKHYIK